jgi:hypothetical protein
MGMNIDDFEGIKAKGEEFYKSIKEVYCPYFQEKVIFNAKGLEHLKFSKKNHARVSGDQYIRFKLLHLAPKVISLSKTIQGVSHRKGFEWMRTNARNEFILKNVSYYEFIAILENVRVRIVIKKVEDSQKYFWSIIPHWKVDKENHKRKMFNGNPEND